MNILFVYSMQHDIRSSRKPLRSSLQMQFGISYISSFLKKQGHNAKLIVLCSHLGKKSEINRNVIDEYVKRFCPELICFTAVYSEYNFIVNIAKYIKTRYPDIYLLIGGCHVSLNPEDKSLDVFDALCIGEGEHPTFELVSQLEKGLIPSAIPNLWIKHGHEIEKNLPHPFLRDLDSLPFPDREMWLDWIEAQSWEKVPVLLGRGCPYNCTYCCNHALKKIAPGRYVRLRSPENILDEIKDIVIRFSETKEIYLEVETYGVNKAWAIELCSTLEGFIKTLAEPLSFGVNLRITPNTDFESLFAACKRSNFKYINIGLESGSEVIRRKILKRNYSNQDIINAVTLARKYGLKVIFYNLIGIPGETLADFKETVEINRICLPDGYYNSIFFPYPGTELHTSCKKMGLLKKDLDSETERRKAALELPGFSRKQIQRCYARFDYYVYKGYKPTYKIFLRRFVPKLYSSNYYLECCYKKLKQLGIFMWLINRLK